VAAARSVKPSVWIERRKNATGFVTYRVRAEKDGQRLPDIVCGSNKDYAVEVRDRRRNELWGTKLSISSAKTMRTLGELVTEYLRESKRDKAPRSHEIDQAALGRMLTYFGTERDLETIQTDSIRAFQRQLVSLRGEPLSKTSEAIYLFAIRAAFNRARKSYKWIDHDPFDGIEIYRVGSKGRYIHDDEFAQIRPLAEAVVRRERSLWEILDIMRHQGLRSGATCALDGRMVNRKTRHLHLTKPARLGIARTAELKNTTLYAPIHRAVWPIFAKAPESGLIFAGWNRNDVAKHTRRICRELKLPHLRPHDMKHTFITNFLQGGGTLAMCSAITGTSEPMLRRVYSHLEGRVPPSEMDRVSYVRSPRTPPKSKAASTR
jgi:integrase